MLHSNIVMEVINENKGIFSFYSHNNEQKNFSESHFYYIVLFVVSMKSVDNQ